MIEKLYFKTEMFRDIDKDSCFDVAQRAQKIFDEWVLAQDRVYYDSELKIWVPGGIGMTSAPKYSGVVIDVKKLNKVTKEKLVFR